MKNTFRNALHTLKNYFKNSVIKNLYQNVLYFENFIPEISFETLILEM